MPLSPLEYLRHILEVSDVVHNRMPTFREQIVQILRQEKAVDPE